MTQSTLYSISYILTSYVIITIAAIYYGQFYIQKRVHCHIIPHLEVTTVAVSFFRISIFNSCPLGCCHLLITEITRYIECCFCFPLQNHQPEELKCSNQSPIQKTATNHHPSTHRLSLHNSLSISVSISTELRTRGGAH